MYRRYADTTWTEYILTSVLQELWLKKWKKEWRDEVENEEEEEGSKGKKYLLHIDILWFIHKRQWAIKVA